MTTVTTFLPPPLPTNPAPGSVALRSPAGVHGEAGPGAGPRLWSCFVPGVPLAKKRPRFTTINGHARAFNCQDTEEGKFRWELLREWGQRTPMTGPLALTVTFEMPIPKGTSKKQAAHMAAETVRHTKKPDLDNLVKFVKDCANGVLWQDDCQVVTLKAAKRYSITPGTYVHIRELS